MRAFTRNFLRDKFREYYLSASLELPPGFESREWGFIQFDDLGMHRHKSYLNRGEIVDYILGMIPAHVYHSAAYYQRPAARTMNEKEWQGADLIFDLDADHLRKASKSYPEMLELVKKETLKLINFLLADFGFPFYLKWCYGLNNCPLFVSMGSNLLLLANQSASRLLKSKGSGYDGNTSIDKVYHRG
ncbi:MAG: hypothetical protein MUO26_12520 [Methanotrichaceae archaeon]|nr:hypothetical protein [Methanotrichaceae archaeon]